MKTHFDRGLQALRQRRRLGYGLAVPALLVVVAIPAAVALNRDGGKPKTVAASGGGTLTTTSVTTTSVPGQTTLGEPAPATTIAVPTPVGARASTSTTSAAPTPTVSPVTTTTMPEIGPCDRSRFTLSRPTTDKATYRPGEEIAVRSTLAFHATKPCGSAVSTRSLKVRDAAGNEVFGVAMVVDYISQPIHAPGETEVIEHRWPQITFTANSQAPPGTYTLVISADELTSPVGSVRLVAG